MTASTAEVISGVIRFAIGLFVTIRMLRMPGIGRHSANGVFYLFALVCLVFAECYWMIYDLLQMNARMPIAANELCEGAMFLLLAKELKTVFPKKFFFYKREVFAAMLFIAASVVLWIVWSGEWLQDIFGGLCFGYLMCFCVIALKEEQLLTRTAWRSMLAGCVLLIALQAGVQLSSGQISHGFDLAAYLLMAAGEAWILVKAVSLFRKQSGYRSLLAISFSGFIWSTSCFYMSSGSWSIFHYVSSIVYIFMMWEAVKKEVLEA